MGIACAPSIPGSGLPQAACLMCPSAQPYMAGPGSLEYAKALRRILASRTSSDRWR